jgi:hypothetical protein
MDAIPLCVDLDGTLILTDTLRKSMQFVLTQKPALLIRIPFWLLAGRPNLKRKLSGHVTLDLASLPWNEPLIAYLKGQREAGRRLILVTGADFHIGTQVAEHWAGLFDEVMGSDGVTNLTGRHKAGALAQRFGVRGFDYAGNEGRDLAVWAVARRAIVVTRSSALLEKAAACCEVEKAFH